MTERQKFQAEIKRLRGAIVAEARRMARDQPMGYQPLLDLVDKLEELEQLEKGNDHERKSS